jgi:molybdate-binding protein
MAVYPGLTYYWAERLARTTVFGRSNVSIVVRYRAVFLLAARRRNSGLPVLAGNRYREVWEVQIGSIETANRNKAQGQRLAFAGRGQKEEEQLGSVKSRWCPVDIGRRQERSNTRRPSL